MKKKSKIGPMESIARRIVELEEKVKKLEAENGRLRSVVERMQEAGFQL